MIFPTSPWSRHFYYLLFDLFLFPQLLNDLVSCGKKKKEKEKINKKHRLDPENLFFAGERSQ
jgi:hypothetical protein